MINNEQQNDTVDENEQDTQPMLQNEEKQDNDLQNVALDVDDENETAENNTKGGYGQVSTNDNDTEQQPTKNKEEEKEKEEFKKGRGCCKILKDGGHMKSIILSIIVWILFFAMFSGNVVAVFFWVFFYICYLVECGFDSTWKYLKNQDTGDATVKHLETLKTNSPSLGWSIACYHYEDVWVKPQLTKSSILWVHGYSTNSPILNSTGYNIQYFTSAYNAYNYVGNHKNRPQIEAIIIPHGYEGDTIQRNILARWKYVPKEEVAFINPQPPKFFRWEGQENLLINAMVSNHVVKKDKKKVVTHRASTNFNFNSWEDTSAKFPKWEYELTKLSIYKSYNLKDQSTVNSYNKQKSVFKSNNNKDEFMDFWETLHINGYKEKMLVKMGEKADSQPWWMTVCGYWTASVFMVTLYPRYKLSSMTGKATWTVHKQLSC